MKRLLSMLLMATILLVPVAYAKDKNAQESKTLFDNSYVTVVFNGIEDAPELGVFYASLTVENKTNKTILVLLDDGSVNDEMITIMSGMPLSILPGKKGTNNFIFSFSQISIDTLDEVDTVSFKVNIIDEDTFNDIWISDEITLRQNKKGSSK